MILSDQNDYKANKMTVFYKDKFISQKLGQYIYNSIPKNNDKIAIICIGSDRSTGDALGPITGSLLSKRNQLSFNVFGTLEHPIHAMNLEKELKKINETQDRKSTRLNSSHVATSYAVVCFANN